MTDRDVVHRVTVLTGATGFLGRQLLTALLASHRDERIIALIRSAGDYSPKQRLERLLASLFADETVRARAAARVTAVEADLADDSLDLFPSLEPQLAGCTCRLIHGAATVALDHPIEKARAMNVEGTRRMLDLAVAIQEIATVERFAYIGTAFVAGLREGLVYEDELDEGQEFHNTYERSKLEAEKLVREYGDRLPITIFRPSVIAGESKTGSTTTFSKVLYWPARIFASGMVLLIPGDPQSCYDLVPVDFVSQALVRILDRPDSVGACYHLASGRSITLDEGVRIAADVFGVRRIPPFVSPRMFFAVIRPLLYVTLFGKRREALIKSAVIIPYLTSTLRFDVSNTQAALEGSPLEVPDPAQYLRTLLTYVKETNWGRRPAKTEQSAQMESQ